MQNVFWTNFHSFQNNQPKIEFMTLYFYTDPWYNNNLQNKSELMYALNRFYYYFSGHNMLIHFWGSNFIFYDCVSVCKVGLFVYGSENYKHFQTSSFALSFCRRHVSGNDFTYI